MNEIIWLIDYELTKSIFGEYLKAISGFDVVLGLRSIEVVFGIA